MYVLEVLANATAVITLQYINLSNQYIEHLKLAKCINYISINKEIGMHTDF